MIEIELVVEFRFYVKSGVGVILTSIAMSCAPLPTDLQAPEDAPRLTPRKVDCVGEQPEIGDIKFYFDSSSVWRRETCVQSFEQDGCGLSIFSDCLNSSRQWVGTIDEELNISLRPLFGDNDSPTARCEGVLEKEVFAKPRPAAGNETRYSAILTCTGVPGVSVLSIESQMSTDFHELYRREDAVQVTRVARPYRDAISNVVSVQTSENKELWVVFRGNTDRSQASLLVQTVTEDFSNADFRSSQEVIPIPNLNNIAVAPNQEFAWAVAGADLIRIKVDTKEQTSFNISDGQDCNQPTDELQVFNSEWVAVAADNKTLFTASPYREGSLVSYVMRQWRVSSSTSAPECISQTRLEGLLGERAFPKKYQLASLTETSTSIYILSENPFSQRGLFRMDFSQDGQSPQFTKLSRDNILDFHVLRDEARIGFVVNNYRSYIEMSLDGEYLPETSVALPWLRSPSTLAYDLVKDQVFVLGYDFCEVTDRSENDPCRNPSAVDEQTIRVIAAGVIDRQSRKAEPRKFVFRDFERGMPTIPTLAEYISEAERMLVFDTTQAYLYIVPTN